MTLVNLCVGSSTCADEKGNFVPAACYVMNKDFTQEILLTVTFKEHNGKTEMNLHHMGVSAGAYSKGQGWNQSFDKQAESLKEMST